MTSSLERIDQSLSTNLWYETDMRGLRAHRVPTWDEWEGGIKGLAVLQHALPMIIGDYINYGEDTFGERYEQVLDLFGEYSYGTVANYASICRSVPYERRAEGLTMAHYKAIRSLPPEDQVHWQDEAIEQGLTSLELWDKVHGKGQSVASIIDDIIETIGTLYYELSDPYIQEHLGHAQRHMQEVKNEVEPTQRIEARTS